LNRMGIVTLGQLAHFKLPYLKKRFGILGEQLYWHAWGLDLSPVHGNFVKTEQKGFGHGISLLRDYSKEDTKVCILDLCEEVCHRARTANKEGKTIHLRIAYSEASAGGFSRSTSIEHPTNITMDVYKVCMHLFHQFYDGHSMVRKVSVTLNNLFDKQTTQLNLFENRSKRGDIGYIMDAIRAKYGATSLLRASSFTDAGILIERSKKIGGHYA